MRTERPLGSLTRAAGLALAVAVSIGVARAQGEGERVETLPLTGSLRAAEAEEFYVPVTSTWNLQLKWLVEEGEPVEIGDPIARFDASGLDDRLFDAEDELDQKRQQREIQFTEGTLKKLDLELALKRAEVEYRKAKLDAAVPQDVLDGQDYRQRQRELDKKRKEFEDARLALSTHETTLSATLAGLDIEIAQLRRQIRETEGELASLEIRATTPGIVVHDEHPWFGRKVREGDNLQATFPVASIPDLDTLEIEAWVSEADAWRLAVGQRARVAFDALPELELEAVVASVGRAGQPRPQWGRETYFEVRLTLSRVDPVVMKPGMSVRCDLAAVAPAIAAAAGGAER